MSNQGGLNYVMDSIFGGGSASYDAVVGPGALETSTAHERVWPAISLEFCPPFPEIGHDVKEGRDLIDCELLVPTIDSWMYSGLSSTRFNTNAIAR
jgi:hypothetical protein